MKNNVAQFNEQNTNGIFSKDELDVMNYELVETLDSLGYEDIEDVPEWVLKYESEKIMNKH